MSTTYNPNGKQPIRQRIEPTVVHITGTLDGTTTIGKVKLDIVCSKITVELRGLTAKVEGSVDGSTWFQLTASATAQFTYGAAAGNHLIKHVRITRSAGTDYAVIIGV